MQTRRGFLAAMAALVPAWLTGRKVEAATEQPKCEVVTATIEKSLGGARYMAKVPHPREGVSHFTAPCYPRDVKCYLDGVDVTRRTRECDTLEGWVDMYDLAPHSPPSGIMLNLGGHHRRHYGNVRVLVDGKPRGEATFSIQADFSEVRKALAQLRKNLSGDDIRNALEVTRTSNDGETVILHYRLKD